MNFPTSPNVTRLIETLIALTEPETMNYTELVGLQHDINTVLTTDPDVLKPTPALDRYQQQLTSTLKQNLATDLDITVKQLDAVNPDQ